MATIIRAAEINPECMTVGDLKKIMADLDDDMPIVVGRGLYDCYNYIQRIAIGKSVLGLLTETCDDEEGRLCR